MDHSANAPHGESPAPPGRAALGDPLIGRVIADRYRVLSLLAAGGMGKVYRAEQLPLGRKVALKVLSDTSPQGERDPAFHRRFFLEASTVSKLTHPNTITVFDYGHVDDIYYIAMELLEGRTLQQAVREEGPFEEERALHVARQLCRSLREAHGHGVIHRDLKSANVFLSHGDDEREAVKVLDFGLVKSLSEGPNDEELTKAGLFLGSPKYMAPEQIRGDRVDVRADIYALGVLLYEMLTGHVPFERSNSVHILMAHIHDEVPSMASASGGRQVAPVIEALVRRCLAKEPRARFASMQELLDALKSCSIGAPDTGEVTLTPAAGRAGYNVALSSCMDSQPLGGVGLAHSEAGLHLTPTTGLGLRGGLGPFVGSQERAVAALRFGSRPLIGRWAAALAIAALLSAAGVLAAAAFGGAFNRHGVGGESLAGSHGPVDTLAPDANALPTPQPASAPAASFGDRSVKLHLRSTPAGATVRVFGKNYGPTPLSVDVAVSPEDQAREITFVFARQGYRDLAVTRPLENDELTIDAPPLQRLPIRPAHAPTPAAREEQQASAALDAPLPVDAELARPNTEGVAAGLGFMPSPY